MKAAVATPLKVLTPAEQQERLRSEARVKGSLHEQGMALKRLKEQDLYRSTHTSWEAYLWDYFRMSKSRANRLIRAAEYVEDVAGYYLDEMVPSGHHSNSLDRSRSPRYIEEIAEPHPEMVPSGHRQSLPWESLPPDVVLPTQEKPLRHALDLPRELRGRAWQLGLELNGGRPPGSAHMAQAVVRVRREQHNEAPPPNPFFVGQICCIHPQNHPELRGLSGAPGIIIQTNEFSCQVRTGLGDRLIPCEHLEALSCNAHEADAMRDRLERLYELSKLEAELDPMAWNAVLQFAKLASLQLTPFQDEMLRFLERQYGLAVPERDEDADMDSSPAVPAMASEQWLTSPPPWAKEELEIGDPPNDPPEPEFFKPREAIRVRAVHPHYGGRTGEVIEVGAVRIAVHLHGVRKKRIELLPSELEKAIAPPEGNARAPSDR